MTDYTTKALLTASYGERELIQLTDRARTGAIDDALLAHAIAEAGAEIDGWLAAAGVPQPYPAAHPLLRQYANDITRYRLYTHAPPEHIRRRYEDAIAWLRVRDGVRTALMPSAVPAATGGTVEWGGTPAHDPAALARFL